jgi:hypothetical protein
MAPNGEFELQDMGIYGDPNIGIRAAGSNSSLNHSSNAFFNDPNLYPNTFDVNTQTGFSVSALDADQSTRIDDDGSPGNTGVTYGYDHSSLGDELQSARSIISSLPSTGTLLTGGDGVLDSDTTVNLDHGLNVIDIDTGGNNDFVLNNMNFVVNGFEDSQVIFRLPDQDNMLISNSNILVGDTGMDLNSMLFFTDQSESDTHFDIDNSILNGVALWSLGENGGDIDISNAQGCVQLIADIVDLDDVRFVRSAFTTIPAPGGLAVLAMGALGLRRRRRDA